jgi:hypothetical protein
LELQIIALSVIVVGLLLYLVVYTSRVTDQEKRRTIRIVIIVVVLWLASQIFMYFSQHGLKP